MSALMTNTYYPVMTIAGSDSCGGAGIQADLKTFAAEGCYGMSAITAVTAQNTMGVEGVWGLPAEAVEAQIRAVAADVRPLALKTGMLFNAAIVETVAGAIERLRLENLVVDPVMISTSGDMLLQLDAVEIMRTRIFPLSALVTPNISEAIVLTGEEEPVAQARALRAMGCRAILLKGGDSDAVPGLKVDRFMDSGSDELVELRADAVPTQNTHGTGCTLSAAIAARLALGDDMATAVARGKLYVTRALRAGADVRTGGGHGPVCHGFDPKRQKIKRI